MKKEDALGYQFRTMANLINRSTDSAISTYEQGNLTSVQGWVMRYLIDTKKEQVFQKDIEEDLAMKSPTASRVLSLMEKNEFITRKSVEQDGRLKQVLPTEKLIEADKFIKKELHNLECKMRDGISESEIKQLFAIIEKIKNNLV